MQQYSNTEWFSTLYRKTYDAIKRRQKIESFESLYHLLLDCMDFYCIISVSAYYVKQEKSKGNFKFVNSHMDRPSIRHQIRLLTQFIECLNYFIQTFNIESKPLSKYRDELSKIVSRRNYSAGPVFESLCKIAQIL